jgi:hypothetical protein
MPSYPSQTAKQIEPDYTDPDFIRREPLIAFLTAMSKHDEAGVETIRRTLDGTNA